MATKIVHEGLCIEVYDNTVCLRIIDGNDSPRANELFEKIEKFVLDLEERGINHRVQKRKTSCGRVPDTVRFTI